MEYGKKIPAKAAHNSASKIGVGEGSGLEKHPLPEMPATRRGVASTKQGKGCLGTPENHGKIKDLRKNKIPERAQRAPIEKYTTTISNVRL